MTKGVIKHLEDANVYFEGKELCREFFHTERIMFGLSELLPGAAGDMNPSHPEADEVYFCMQGQVLCLLPEDEKYYELKVGDALLIPPNTGHQLFNIGDEKAIIIWSLAPRP